MSQQPTTNDEQRVVVTTAPDSPSFLVHKNVRAKFIDEKVAELFGHQQRRPGKVPHEWEAYGAESAFHDAKDDDPATDTD